MSSFGGGGGGKTRMQTKVYLNVYDLSPANQYLYPIGLGLHHTGVEIAGSEYSFGSGSGIFEMPPGSYQQQASSHDQQQQMVPFREQIYMGSFDGGSQELKRAIDELRDSFPPNEYNLIRKNCNHFSNALCWKLLRTPIPSHLNRISQVGECVSCLLPRKMLENARVGGDTSSSSSSAPTSSHMVGRNPSTSAELFGGKGNRLGGGNSVSGSSNSSTGSTTASSSSSWLGFMGGSSVAPTSTAVGISTNRRNGQDDLTDRREKARKAALARLEQQQKQSQSE